MDAARTAFKIRSRDSHSLEEVKQNFQQELEEVHHAKEEGIISDLLVNPIENYWR